MQKSKSVTIKTIADILKISPTTVSKALRDRDDIAADTKIKVKALAEKLHYYPNLMAKSLVSGRTHMIGAIVPELKTSFFAAAARGIYERAQAAGYMAILMVSDNNSENDRLSLQYLSSLPVDGILIAISPGHAGRMILERLHERGFPMVCYDRQIEGLEVSSVTIDDYKAAVLLVEHIIQSGRRHIAYLGKSSHTTIANARFMGYYETMQSHGLTPLDEYCIDIQVDQASGYKKIKELLASGLELDAVVCTSDLVALGVGQGVLEANLSIPDDIMLAGFGNIDQVDKLGVKYITIDQNPFAIGQKAVELVLQEIENKDRLHQVEHVVIEAKLVMRESLGASITTIRAAGECPKSSLSEP